MATSPYFYFTFFFGGGGQIGLDFYNQIRKQKYYTQKPRDIRFILQHPLPEQSPRPNLLGTDIWFIRLSED